MSRLLCWLFGHAPARDVDADMSLVYHCERCRQLVPGGLAPRGRQPAPRVDGAGPECWPALLEQLKPEPWLVELIRERDAMGRQKYGTPLRVWDGRDAVADALQEALDLAVYLQRAMMRVRACGVEADDTTHVRLRLLRAHALNHVRELLDLADKMPEVKP